MLLPTRFYPHHDHETTIAIMISQGHRGAWHEHFGHSMMIGGVLSKE